jgi:hypothetical protein
MFTVLFALFTAFAPIPAPVHQISAVPVTYTATVSAEDSPVGHRVPQFVNAFDKPACYAMGSTVFCPGEAPKLHAITEITCPYYRNLVREGRLAPEVTDDPASVCSR